LFVRFVLALELVVPLSRGVDEVFQGTEKWRWFVEIVVPDSSQRRFASERFDILKSVSKQRRK